MESRLWRVAGLLPVAVVALGLLGAVVASLKGGAIAMLDLTPLRGPWELILGLDDGAADAPLFHLLLAGSTWQFGMGFGTLLTIAVCLGLAGGGVAALHDSRAARGISAMVFLGLPFSITRLHHGQVAFLAAVGLCLLAGRSVRGGRYMLGGGLWAASALMAPHTVLIGLPFMIWCAKRESMTKVRWFAVFAPVIVAVGPLITAHAMLPGGVELDTALTRFAARYGTSVGGVWRALSQQGFWAGDVSSLSAAVVALCAISTVLILPGRDRSRVALLVLVTPVVVVVLSSVLGALIDAFAPIALLREPHKLLVVPAIALAWAAGVAAERRCARVQLGVLFAAGVLAVGGIAGAMGGVTMKPSTVDALEAVRATVGDDVVVTLPAMRYAYLVDVATEVQDLVPRWVGGTMMREVSTVSDASVTQLRLVKRFVASGGADTAALSLSGARWVVAVRTNQDGMSWLGSNPQLLRRITGTIELYEVREPAECRDKCVVQHQSGVKLAMVLLVLAMLSGPGVVVCALVSCAIWRWRKLALDRDDEEADVDAVLPDSRGDDAGADAYVPDPEVAGH
jgi:hypothetical protein